MLRIDDIHGFAVIEYVRFKSPKHSTKNIFLKTVHKKVVSWRYDFFIYFTHHVAKKLFLLIRFFG